MDDKGGDKRYFEGVNVDQINEPGRIMSEEKPHCVVTADNVCINVVTCYYQM